MKLILSSIGALVIGGLVGGYVGGQLGGKGGTVLGMCEVAKVAGVENFLSAAEVTQLAEATGRDMESNYPAIAKRLVLSEASKSNASAGSDCSQFLMHMNIGMDSVG